ncbi:MAG: hypothetical protein QGF00_36350 [Planctomycetota bacterium]|jgi:hypothetical protein|nr:hypothetical protein [Planctomycetota bacterium]
MKKALLVISLLALLVLSLWFIYESECSRLSSRAATLMSSEISRWGQYGNVVTADPIFSVGFRGVECRMNAWPKWTGIRTGKSLRSVRVTVSSFGEKVLTDRGIPF